MTKHKGNHNRSSGFISVIKHILQNFCFDFLGVYNIYTENSFANKLTR